MSSNYSWFFLAQMVDKYEGLVAEAEKKSDPIEKIVFLKQQLYYYKLQFNAFQN